MSGAFDSTDGLSTISDGAFEDNFDEEFINDQQNIIYGRKSQRSELLKAFEELIKTKSCQTVCVHGCSGSGKTVLVEELRDFLCESYRCYFCSGKYFQSSGGQEPFSAMTAAFSDLCDLVSQSDDFDEERKLQIRQKLGPDAQMLLKMISNLTPFIDYKSEEEHISDCNMGVKFNSAFKAFLHAMSVGSRPIVLFLDDIQWMDQGSRRLLELYLNDSELQNIMFILAYRDEDNHVVHSHLSNIKKDGFWDVQVENFSASGVAQMISGLLRTPENVVSDLSEIIVQKTHGNPFYVLQFIDAIQRNGLLVWDPVTETWAFDVNEIQTAMMVRETLADLLLQKISLLPQYVQETLKIASLLVNHFEEDILEVILTEYKEDHSSPEPDDEEVVHKMSLDQAIGFGLVEKTPHGYQFSHDKIQTAFQSMISETEMQELQKIIGECFLYIGDEEGIYFAAVHLNKAARLIEDKDQKIRLVRVNLDAAKYCTERSAFEDAASLLRQGLSLLDEKDKWETNFELTFEITESLAKMELILGNLVRCKELTHEALQRATSTDMKIKSLLIDIECQMAGNEMEATRKSATRALAILGVHMPRKVNMYHVMTFLFKIRRTLKGRTDEDILELPVVLDRSIAAAARILLNLTFYCFMQDEVPTGVFSALVALRLTLRYGLSPHSASGIIVYGMIEISFQNVDRAFRFGQLGLKLLATKQLRDTECAALTVWVSMLSHLKLSLDDVREPMHRAVECGFSVGDPVYTSFALANDFSLNYYMGVNLVTLEHYMRERYAQLRDVSRKSMLLWAQAAFQLVLNLQRDESEFCQEELIHLTGEVMNEDEYIREAVKANHPMLHTVALVYKLQLCYYFGFYLEAEHIIKEMSRIGEMFNYHFGAVFYYSFQSLTFYERYRETGRRPYLQRTRGLYGKLKRMDSQGNPNVQAFVLLLEAEDKSVLRSVKPDTISHAYNVAISAFSDSAQVQMQALANERAGFAMAKMGKTHDAIIYFEKAVILYRDSWGATAKFESLQERLVPFLAQITGSTSGPEVVGNIVQIVPPEELHAGCPPGHW